MRLKLAQLLTAFRARARARIPCTDFDFDFPKHSDRRRGMLMVIVIWTITALTVVAATLAFDVQVNSKLAMIQREQFTAYQLARAGVGEGMTHLQNDVLLDYAENPNQMYDSFADVWAQPDVKEEDREIKLGKGTYEFEVLDEEGKIPLNYANMKLYQGMLEFYGYEGEDSLDVAQALWDYRDGDDIAGATGEKENEHYSAIVDENFNPDQPPEIMPYQTPNEPFLAVEQLLDVYGVTPELYYGYDPEELEEDALRLRNNLVLGKGAPRKSSTQRKRERNQVLPLKDIVTVYPTSNRINVNTASAEVLTVLFYSASNFGDLKGAQDSAEAIVKFRGDMARGGRKKDDDDVFKSEADLMKVPGINPAMVSQLRSAGALGVTLGYKSDTYRIVSVGRMGRVQRTIQAIVRRNLDPYNPDDARLQDRRRARGERTTSRAARPSRRRDGQDDNIIRIPAIRVAQWVE